MREFCPDRPHRREIRWVVSNAHETLGCMDSRSPIGRPCEYCGRVQLVGARGGEYCLPCADPTSDAPLVPATYSVTQFLRIQKSYETYRNALSKYTMEQLEEMFPPPRWTKDKPKRNQRLIPFLHEPVPVVRTARGGAPRKLATSDLQRLRRMVKDQPGLWTLRMLAERFPDKDGKPPHPRTMRRALKELGLKLKHPPGR